MRFSCPFLLSSLLLLSACQTSSVREPATLVSADEMTLARIKEVLAGAVGRADIHLGAGDLTASSTITVLPPPPGPNETNSPAMPVSFDLETNGRDCFLVQRDSGKSYRLHDVPCEAADA